MSEDLSAKDIFELMQKMWNPLAFPMPGIMAPTANIEEINKKMAELQVIENWLKMNVGFVQMTIKTLELQKASLEALSAANKKD